VAGARIDDVAHSFSLMVEKLIATTGSAHRLVAK
jgi:hypothetical protein